MDKREQIENQTEEEFLNKLWECYDKGVRIENLPPDILFKTLIRDLIRQIEGR